MCTEENIMVFDRIADEVIDLVELELDDSGYITREGLKSLFDDARDEINGCGLVGYSKEIEIGSAKICALPMLHIARDYTEATSLRIDFPSGNIIQTTEIEGFV